MQKRPSSAAVEASSSSSSITYALLSHAGRPPVFLPQTPGPRVIRTATVRAEIYRPHERPPRWAEQKAKPRWESPGGDSLVSAE